MKQRALAAQLYTIRDYTKTRADFAQSMRKIREIGYRLVQVSAVGAVDDADIKRICDDNGLAICNTHVSLDQLQNDIKSVIAQHELWDCRHVAIGSMPPEFRGSEAGFRRFAAIANGIGESLARAGLSFSYHNHSFEFIKFGDRSGLDIFFEETDPQYVQAELDTYWIQHGGADPILWIDRMTGRMPVIHLKDMVMLPPPHPNVLTGKGGWKPPQQAMAEVGAGNMNFPGIVEACQRAGVEFYAVEQDICQRDAFESLAISYRNLRGLGLS